MSLSAHHSKSALDTACTIAVLIAAALVIWTHLRPSDLAPPPRPSAVEDLDERIDAAVITKRRGTGKIALVEFADYECPYCARHTREVYPTINREFIDRGLVQHVFLNYPLESKHPRAVKASEAAECASGQNRFWEMHERLFGDTGLHEGDIMQYATALGLDEERFAMCLAGEAPSAVARDLAEGKRLGVRGTPAFFIGAFEEDGSIRLRRRINGAWPFDIFREEITAALNGSGQITTSWWWLSQPIWRATQ